MPSIFTKIINGEIPCYKIYEDDKTFAFLDIHPETRGHTLVVPKKEVDKLYDLEDEDYFAVMNTARKLSSHMEKVLGARTLWKVVGTDVPHAHIHLCHSTTLGNTATLSSSPLKNSKQSARNSLITTSATRPFPISWKGSIIFLYKNNEESS